MADPYATRRAGPAGDRPAAASPHAPIVSDRGGLAVATLSELASAEPAAAGFIAVMRTDEGLLPPLARLDPAFAIALLAGSGAGDDAATAGEAGLALAALRAADLPIYLVKDGLVAGPAGREGAFEVTGTLIEAALAGALASAVEWERDPDFGYEVIGSIGSTASTDGLSGAEADALCPRLTYAAADRVYEHAELVAQVKRERRERLDRIGGLDPVILAASGWPVEPTSTSWKD